MSSFIRTTEPASAVLPTLRPTHSDECSRCCTFSPAVGVGGVLHSGRSDRRAAVSRFNVHLLGARDGMLTCRLYLSGFVNIFKTIFQWGCFLTVEF